VWFWCFGVFPGFSGVWVGIMRVLLFVVCGMFVVGLQVGCDVLWDFDFGFLFVVCGGV